MNDERLKIWIDLGKWLIVSVGLVVMTKIIDAGFKDREVGMNELKEYGKYVELVTDYNKIAERRLLAQYFAHITPSDKLREGWIRYYESINTEYKKTLQQRASKNEELSKFSLDDKTRGADREKINVLRSEIEKLDYELTPTFQSNSNYEAAKTWENLGFQYLIEKNIRDAIDAFEKAEKAQNSYHQVYEIARYLRTENSKVKDSEKIDWPNIYKTILNEYSWKMPEEIKTELNRKVD